MSIPSSIHFHNMDRSPALETDIKNHVESLSQFFDRIIDCQVTIDAPHRHHHKGLRYRVVINISVPGDTLVVSHEDESSPAHDDCYVTVRDAFRSARRQLQDYARIRRKKIKRDESSAKREFRVKLGQVDSKHE
jgi:ribosome-associated translation inhibitor RaiA